MALKGKWAQGIRPRNFAWVIKDVLAVCERPGGYGVNHRRVRRSEEIIWIREQGFDLVISLMPSTHNLHNYDEQGLAWRHRPFGQNDEPEAVLAGLYPELAELVASRTRVLVHGEELGDRLSGLIAGYLVWSGLVPEAPRATSLVERMLGRQIGPPGRELVAVAQNTAGP